MTRQMADDEVLRVLDMFIDGSEESRQVTNQLREARAAVAALQAERDALRDDVKLLTHKVITCGVAATHPDPALSSSGAYGGKWDSPQAQAVRALRGRAERAESALEALRGQVAGLVAAASAHLLQDTRDTFGRLKNELLAIKERMG